MLRQKFNDGWTFRDEESVSTHGRPGEQTAVPVDLPHDYMILKEKDPDAPGQGRTGFFPNGTGFYSKVFTAPAEWAGKKVQVEFEAVYMNAYVKFNGNYIGKEPYGYSVFRVDLTPYLVVGAENTLTVQVKNNNAPNTRWYSGSGIYRDVNLFVSEQLHIVPDGVKLTTPEADDDLALVVADVEVGYHGVGRAKAYILTELFNAAGEKVAWNKALVTARPEQIVSTRQRMEIDRPALWSPETPSLYTCVTTLSVDGREVDRSETAFGVRTFRLDRKYGFRLNGRQMKLRGGCFHHDNGVIGACAFARAEERKIELHKAAGFNALRSTHNPASRALLEACDRIGMIVIDESFDMWNECKTMYDYGMYFEDWWQRDLKAMVDKDYNHPSVLFYSIGNEIMEKGDTSDGAAWSRRQAEYIRSIDASRAVISSINKFAPVAMDYKKPPHEMTLAETMEFRDSLTFSENYAGRTEEFVEPWDMVGYNYQDLRFETDAELFPNRIFCTTESHPMQFARVWGYAERYPYILGDFVWTSMDYIGEAGIGKIDYDRKSGFGFRGGYPWTLAYCGDIDLIGFRRPQSYFREIVWGKRTVPYVAVGRAERYGQLASYTPWSWTDVIESWTWPGFDGKPVGVEIYSPADEVELFVNGKSVGKRPAGKAHGYRALFETVYQPGELLAVNCSGAGAGEKMVIKTTGTAVALKAEADRTNLTADGADLCHIMIAIVDADGNVNPSMDKKVKVTVTGAGSLQGSGSGDPTTKENYFDDVSTTFDGRMLAVVRAGKAAGSIDVTVACDGLTPARLTLSVK